MTRELYTLLCCLGAVVFFSITAWIERTVTKDTPVCSLVFLAASLLFTLLSLILLLIAISTHFPSAGAR